MTWEDLAHEIGNILVPLNNTLQRVNMTPEERERVDRGMARLFHMQRDIRAEALKETSSTYRPPSDMNDHDKIEAIRARLASANPNAFRNILEWRDNTRFLLTVLDRLIASQVPKGD
jgi:hypothetical protein